MDADERTTTRAKVEAAFRKVVSKDRQGDVPKVLYLLPQVPVRTAGTVPKNFRINSTKVAPELRKLKALAKKLLDHIEGRSCSTAQALPRDLASAPSATARSDSLAAVGQRTPSWPRATLLRDLPATIEWANKTPKDEHLKALSSALMNHIENMHGSTIQALHSGGALPVFETQEADGLDSSEPTWPQRETLRRDLAHTLEAVEIALKTDHASGPKASGGQPENCQADAIVAVTGYCYHCLTGKRPTVTVDPVALTASATGPYVKLLTAVFEALGIAQSPEHYAKRASDRWPKPARGKKMGSSAKSVRTANTRGVCGGSKVSSRGWHLDVHSASTLRVATCRIPIAFCGRFAMSECSRSRRT